MLLLRQQIATTEELNNFMGTMLLLLSPEGSGGADPTEKLLAKAEEAAGRFAQAPEIQARLSDQIGAVLLARGQFDAAAPQFERALRLWTQTRGEENESAMTSGLNLAAVMREQGRLSQARERSESIARSRARTAATPLRDILAVNMLHAQILLDMGDVDQAIVESKASFEKSSLSLGESDPMTLTLGGVYSLALRDRAAPADLQLAIELGQRVMSAGSRRAGSVQASPAADNGEARREEIQATHDLASILSVAGHQKRPMRCSNEPSAKAPCSSMADRTPVTIILTCSSGRTTEHATVFAWPPNRVRDPQLTNLRTMWSLAPAGHASPLRRLASAWIRPSYCSSKSCRRRSGCAAGSICRH